MGLFSKKKAAPVVAPAAAAASQPAARPVSAAASAESMQEVIFKMRFSSKTLGRQAAKSEKQIQVEERKAKDALAKNNMAGARIHAENAIRNRTESLGYLKLQSQLEAVAAKLHSQQIRSQVSDDMVSVTNNLSEALGAMDISKIGYTMEKFIKQSEDLDLQTKYMDTAIGESTASSTPQNQVDSLLQRIADENNLEFTDRMNDISAPVGQPTHLGAMPNQVGQSDQSTLEARIATLRPGRP